MAHDVPASRAGPNALRDALDYNAPMFSMTKRRVLHVWIALLAILFGALAPAVSHALAVADHHADKVELCTATGVQLVEVPAADAGKKPLPPMHDMGHCTCCTSHHTVHALPASSAAAIALTGGRTIYPPLFYAAPRRLHAWSAAAPRGPPLTA